jgi:hypothetical protein
MSEPTSFEGLALILGRVEGKVDTILAAEQRRDEQIARLDARMSAVENQTVRRGSQGVSAARRWLLRSGQAQSQSSAS